jgi:hypothetical protein
MVSPCQKAAALSLKTVEMSHLQAMIGQPKSET